VDILQKVYVDLGLGSMWIYAKEVNVGLGLGSSGDLLRGSVCVGSFVDLRGSLCGSRPTKCV
jgi:hypothetical protein